MGTVGAVARTCLGLRGSQRGPPIYLQRMKRDGTGGAKERQQDKGF